VPQRRPPSQRAREGQPPPRSAEPDLFASPDALPGETPAFESIVADSSRDLVPGGSPRSAVTVSTLTQTTKDVLEGAFMPLWVRGEVSDFKAHRSGHWYFSLRDERAQLRCVVWSRDRRGIPAPPDDGMLVAALGQLSVYAARGEIQFSVRRIEAEGDGLWRKALELTRRRLEADGLLKPERKRALPRYPRVLGVVTSIAGAALHDIVAVVQRRAPHVRIVVVQAAVQGDTAPDELCAAIDRVSRWGRADVVIVGRGGGAREDLWAFNDERVARALAGCPAPTISAVGHEIDVTICDLVADLRAPTPSAAAEAAVRTTDELLGDLAARQQRMYGALAGRLEEADTRIRRLARDLAASSRRDVERRQAMLATGAGRLQALSPLATLARGYAIARDPAGRTLAETSMFAAGEAFELMLRDGTVNANTLSVEPKSTE
jgi:exodeoxyribonuclease VII large subunit